MRLYVANLTKQNIEFAYRVPETTGIRTQHIRIGTQILISGDLTSRQIDGIIEQHRRYGLVDVADIKNLRAYTGMCFSIDKPIPANWIEIALQSNTVILLDKGKQNRERVAVAANNALENNLQESGIPGNLDHMDVTIVEEDRKRPSELDGPAVAEAMRVTRDMPDGSRQEPTKGSRRRGRQAA